MHHGPAERPAVAAWLYGYRKRCVSRVPSSVHSLLTDLSFVLFHVDSRTRINQVLRSAALLPSCLQSCILKTFEGFNFCETRVNYIMLIIFIIISHSHLYNRHVTVNTLELINLKLDELIWFTIIIFITVYQYMSIINLIFFFFIDFSLRYILFCLT